MVQSARIFLSRAGKAVLGTFFGLGESTPNAVGGFLVGYDDKGVWFQDDRLQQEGKTLLIKWRFVDAILSDVMGAGEESVHDGIGFLPRTRNWE
jgi:hypothetical protein